MLLSFLKIFLFLYFAICVLLYFFQEKLIFFPEKIAKGYQFQFSPQFEELFINTTENVSLNALLFKSLKSKGVIFYLHGNAGSLRSWGDVASVYTDLGYDVFMLDYRGYGKSEGKISSESGLYNDVQAAYNMLKGRYDESRIIVLGYSIGTGPATKIASANRPKLLVLQAPYFSLTDVMKKHYSVIPSFILRYPFETYRFITKCTMPVVIFHGGEDTIIPVEQSMKLKGLIKETDVFIRLTGVGHNGMSSSHQYLSEMHKLLM